MKKVVKIVNVQCEKKEAGNCISPNKQKPGINKNFRATGKEKAPPKSRKMEAGYGGGVRNDCKKQSPCEMYHGDHKPDARRAASQ